MLATVTGLQGGAHNGLGKGFGGLLGGFTIEYTKVGVLCDMVVGVNGETCVQNSLSCGKMHLFSNSFLYSILK